MSDEVSQSDAFEGLRSDDSAQYPATPPSTPEAVYGDVLAGRYSLLTRSQVHKLDQPISGSRIRLQPFGAKYKYLEGHDVIDMANKIFGYDGWSTKVIRVELVHLPDTQDWAYEAVVEVTAGAATKQDIGSCNVEKDRKTQVPSNATLDTARKGAVTDAMKRAFRYFGSQFGNSLYDVDDQRIDYTDSEESSPKVSGPAAKGTAAARATPSQASEAPKEKHYCSVCNAEIQAHKSTKTGRYFSADDMYKIGMDNYGVPLCTQHYAEKQKAVAG